MPTNPYFNFVSQASEQSLVDDLIVESIQIYGHSAYYVRREDANLDQLFGEDPIARYDTGQEIEIYLKSSTSFSGSSETLSKFGLVIEDDATFLVSATRFDAVTGMVRPRENDIIYIQFTPTNRYLFEIRFVENKEQLFQLGKLYTYELRCSMMQYSHERFDTGVADADDAAARDAYAVDVTVAAGGNGEFVVGESVWQGNNALQAVATGIVQTWDSPTLSLSSVTGAFNTVDRITGGTSGAWRNPAATTPAVTSPTPHDPVTDNDFITSEQSDVMVPIHNPRFNS